MTAKKWIPALFGFFAIVCITNVCYCDDNAGAGTDDLDNTTPENCSTTSDVSNDGRCNTSNNIAVDRNRKNIFDNETRSPNDTSTPEPHSTDTTATHSQSPNDLITTISIRPGDEANTTKNDTLPTPKTTSTNGTDDDASTSSDRTPGSDVIPSGNESTSNVNPPDHGDSTAAPGNDTTDAASTVKPPSQDKPAEDPGFPDVIKRRDDIFAKIKSMIQIGGDFDKDLEDQSSTKFRDEKNNYEKRLADIYRAFPNFVRVEVQSFREGSVIVDYTVQYDLATLTDNEASSKWEEVSKGLQNIPNINETALNESLSAERKQLEGYINDPCTLENVCDSSFKCNYTLGSGDVKCIHKCKAENPGCQNGGFCVLNLAYVPVCSCVRSGGFVYSGDTCEVKTERLLVSKNVLIAICAGGGGGIIFILIITVIILCCRRDQDKDIAYLNDSKPRGASEASFNSIKDAENALNETDIAGANAAYVNKGFTNVEENALNARSPNINDYTMVSTSFSMDLSNGYELQDRPNSSSSRNNVENNPDYPRNSRTYEEIDDKGTRAIMYKGASTAQESPAGQIYDYDDRTSKQLSRKSGTTLYDFDELNRQEAYKIRRPTINSGTPY